MSKRGLSLTIAMDHLGESVWRLIRPVFAFPRPTGPYGIGSVTYHWVDVDRSEVFSSNPDDRRELMAQDWYPAKEAPASPRASYMPEATAVAPALASFLGV